MSSKSKQKAGSRAGTAPVPVAGQSPPAEGLKAERVQLQAEPPFPARPLSERLKAERVQERLRAMPGWHLASGTHAIDRVRLFPSSPAAAAFAGFLLQFAAHAGQPVDVSLAGPQVVITVRARDRRGLSETALDFAQALG